MAQTPKYSVGDKVVHPQHGAATIQKKVKQEFGGKKMDYFILDIATEQLTVMVPVDRVEDLIRPVISKAKSRDVLKSLKGEPEEAGANWSRWYKVLNEKMTSGDIFQVAEVVRDLTLSSELAFSLEVDDEEAIRKLDRALPKVDALEE
jgi:CarD family transcriptional regulator